jgi:hypothetical protein
MERGLPQVRAVRNFLRLLCVEPIFVSIFKNLFAKVSSHHRLGQIGRNTVADPGDLLRLRADQDVPFCMLAELSAEQFQRL